MKAVHHLAKLQKIEESEIHSICGIVLKTDKGFVENILGYLQSLFFCVGVGQETQTENADNRNSCVLFPCDFFFVRH